MFDTVLVANRGEIARRIIRTLKSLGIKSVAVYSDADKHAPHVREADQAVHIGPSPVSESYLQADRIVQACLETGAQAVHPGYGFLSENVTFAEKLAAKGVTFIGPRPEHLTKFGLKHEARAAAEKAGVPLLPGTNLLKDLAEAKKEAARIGFPLMLKSTAGGGGIGLRLCQSMAELEAEFDVVRKLGAGNFGDDGVFLEKFVQTARHVEVQIFGDGKGKVIALGERDCSLQRRNQKLVEEAPAPNLSEDTRTALHEAAISLGQEVSYVSAGTVEFIYDVATEEFYFLEVNTRLQVEHGVTEEIFGVDLVEMMVKQAADELGALDAIALNPKGWAMEIRINAEDPARDYRPSAGTLSQVVFPDEVRLDGWVENGTTVTAFYDNLMAKLIVKGDSRNATIDAMVKAIQGSRLYGLETNLAYLGEIVTTDWFKGGDVSTQKLASFDFVAQSVEVLAAGAQTTVQDWPGRIGYWDVGVPPSGPMDGLSFRLANKLLGNKEGAAGLECAVNGPTLRFNCDTVIALGGAHMVPTLDGNPIDMWSPVSVSKGQILTLGAIEGAGQRTYIAFRGGLDVPLYLGSGACFTLGQFGGHTTNALRAGDALRLHKAEAVEPCGSVLADGLKPALTHTWDIGVLYGPHGAPDFFTDEDIETFFSTDYEVHFNSARTGVRLIGPKPSWARTDGGEAGLHPSNIHDNAYAIGSIDFTGDMPIILGPDGPSLGGFVCPATIIRSELWKMGQLKPGDKVRFIPTSLDQAAKRLDRQNSAIEQLNTLQVPAFIKPTTAEMDVILRKAVSNDTQWVYRRAGDDYMLVEFGALQLDLNLRFQAHMLMNWVIEQKIAGIIDLTPGIRSLQIHFDSTVIGAHKLVDVLQQAESELNALNGVKVPSRVVHLPLSWDDESTQEAIRKYESGVRPDAPWCPSNIEFIRRINGLADEQAVKDIVYNADYMVMGLGDVYLGAPVATPVDPRHRLVTTKYNPARTWTPENAVGIGGAYMCIYGMEGPGGYQFVGRTVQVWNKWRQTDLFKDDKPWLLRFFDRIKFYPVDAQELAEAREAFPYGAYPIKVEDGEFDLNSYNLFLKEHAEGIANFQTNRQAAFDAERKRWEEQGLATYVAEEANVQAAEAEINLPPNGFSADAGLPGTVWKVLVNQGETVEAGQPVAILESMKMEVEVFSPQAGIVHEILTQSGQAVGNGQAMMTFTRG